LKTLADLHFKEVIISLFCILQK